MTELGYVGLLGFVGGFVGLVGGLFGVGLKGLNVG